MWLFYGLRRLILSSTIFLLIASAMGLKKVSSRAERIGVQVEETLKANTGRFHRRKDTWCVQLVRKLRKRWPSQLRWVTANRITGVRLLSAICISIIIIFERPERNVLIISLLALGLVSDFFDGIFARAFGASRTLRQKAFGSFLDKLSDRLLYIPLTSVLYWPHDHPWVQLVVIMSIIGGVASIFWQLINWLREDTKEVPENYASKCSAVCYVLVVAIPLLWPEYWRIGFGCAIVAGILGLQSVYKGIKNIINGI